MPRRRRDDSGDKFEAIAKAVLAVIILLALAAGGIGGFARAFVSFLFFGVGLALVGGTCFLVMRSRLIRAKRLGLTLILLGGSTLWFWRALQPPPTWTETQATIRSVVSPPCQTETDYTFQTQGQTLKFTLKKEWKSVDEARRLSTTAIVVYFNPSNPTDVSEKPVNGWTRVSATPQATRYHLQGNFEATLAIGRDLFSTSTATITGPAADNKVGATISVWVNPLNPRELSPVPRDTVGGKQIPMFILAIIGVGVGIGFLFTSRQWIAPVPSDSVYEPPVRATVPPPPRYQSAADLPKYSSSAPTNNEPRPHLVWSNASIREALDEIDWYQFEKFCAALLRADGFQVERKGGAQPDGGVDLIVAKSGARALIQCKHWKTWVVQEKVIREMLGSMTHFKVSQGAIYTLKGWTEPARRFAAEHDITLVNGDELAQSAMTQLTSTQLEELLRPREHHCPKCESEMVLKTGNFEPFWGCSRYPACRGKLNHAGAR